MTFGVGDEDAITRMMAGVSLSDDSTAHHKDPIGLLEDNEVGELRDTAAVVTLNNPLDQSPLIKGGKVVVILAGYTRDHNVPN